jgi:hypothetical protein
MLVAGLPSANTRLENKHGESAPSRSRFCCRTARISKRIFESALVSARRRIVPRTPDALRREINGKENLF